MYDPHSFLPKDLYPTHLSIICNVSFTRREIDVMACLLSARKTSKIAYFLSVDPRTIETHIRNITLKLERNTREAIIDFLEASDKVPFLRQHYFYLQIESAFEKSLKELSKLICKENSISILVHGENSISPSPFISLLNTHLKLMGVTVLDHGEKHERAHLIYVLPTNLQDALSSFVKIINQFPKNKVLLLLTTGQEKREFPKEFKGLETIKMTKYLNYYFYFFALVEKIFPTLKFDSVIANFKEKYKTLQRGRQSEPAQAVPPSTVKKSGDFLVRIKSILQTKKGVTSATLLVIGLFIIVFFTFFSKPENANLNHSVVLSELPIPPEPTFLERSELLSQISNGFNQQKAIQTVAIIGIGGAGKTTLARRYARQQKSNVIWEINAETQESLKASFEKLAHYLAKAAKDKQLLRETQEIKDSTLREEKILLFVKKHLKLQSNWFLIYDNVEFFADIQTYFPQDVNIWGQGKVILTTRNATIQNNGWVNKVIFVGELTQKQKIDLFTKIINHGQSSPLIPTQQTISFLQNIPPFPLDVSVAAYYLKMTNSPYVKYLEHLNQQDNNFIAVQEKLLKEAGKYTKTRYGIITLALKCVIDSHKDFRDLLLFISLLDSQNIPRELLDKYKNSTVVDNFIYTLKRYSLITNMSSDFSPPYTLSFHRSTQAITLAYLTKLLNLEKNRRSIEPIGLAFKNYAIEVIDNKDFSKNNLLIKHCKVFLSHSNILTDFILASIGAELGSAYKHLGNYEKAKQLYEESLEVYRKNSYENHPWFARTLAWLGSVYREQGNYEKAKQLYEESLEVYKKNSYENHPWFAQDLGRLGNVYRDQGNYEKARQHLEKSLIIYRKNFYDNHPLFAQALGRLGNVYREQGNYEKARQLYEESLEVCRKNSYNDYPLFARVLGRLGNVYREQGNYEKARQLYEESLEVYRKNSYENHRWFAQSLGRLGNVYRDQGNYEKARQHLEKSLIIYRKNSYENHPWFAQTLGWLGNVYVDLGHYGKAKQLFEASLVIYKKNSYENHPWFARTLALLGRGYILEGQLKTAEKIIHQSLEVFSNNHHSGSYECLELLAELFLKKSIHAATKKEKKEAQVHKAKAIDYLKKALAVLKTHFPKESPHRTRVELKLKGLEESKTLY